MVEEALAGLKAGLDAAAIKLATADLNEELATLPRHRTQVDAWRADAVAEGTGSGNFGS